MNFEPGTSSADLRRELDQRTAASRKLAKLFLMFLAGLPNMLALVVRLCDKQLIWDKLMDLRFSSFWAALLQRCSISCKANVTLLTCVAMIFVL